MTRTRTTDLPLEPAPVLTMSLTAGFGVALLMWVIALLTHLPELTAPPALAGPFLILALAVGCLITSRWATRLLGRSCPVAIPAMAGLVATMVCLLILGSYLTESPEGLNPDAVSGRARPGALLAASGFLALGALVGAIAGVLGRVIFKPAPGAVASSTGQARVRAVRWFGLAASLVFLPLLALGGATTSAEAGFAVPDWPGSYGANMFLFPISQMAHTRIFLEHSHRLFGSLTGLTVLVWTVLLWATPTVRTSWRVFATVLFVLVSIQGFVGGVWVLEQNPVLVVSHGVLAQIVFALVIGLSAWIATSTSLSDSDSQAPVSTVGRRARLMGSLAIGALVIMLTFGAIYRHTHASHALWSHIGFSLVVVALVSAAAFVGIRTGALYDRPALKLTGQGLIGLLGTQFALGWLVLLLVSTGSAADSTGPAIPQANELALAAPVGAAEVLSATAHQVIGASLLGLTTLLTVLCVRYARSVASPAHPRDEASALANAPDGLATAT